jgi:hypothetical protein
MLVTIYHHLNIIGGVLEMRRRNSIMSITILLAIVGIPAYIQKGPESIIRRAIAIIERCFPIVPFMTQR